MKRNKLKSAFNQTLDDYLETRTVNGIWLLKDTDNPRPFRIFWMGLIICLFFLGAYLSFALWMNFYSYPVITSNGDDLPASTVPFPGISICKPLVFHMEKAKMFVKSLKHKDGFNDSDIIEGLKYIAAFTTQQWEFPTGYTYEIADKVLELNGLSIKDAAFNVSSDCSDFLNVCYWNFNRFDCLNTSSHVLRFSLSTTYLGPCCSLNANSMNTSFTPFSTNSFGISSGLTIVGSEGRFSNLSTGLIILVHHPQDYPTESVPTVTIKTGSETFIEIQPFNHSTSKEILDISPDKRNCYTSSDLELNFYRASLCVLNCANQEILKKCGCYPYQMQNNMNKVVDECKLKDAFCYTEHFDNFKNTKCTECLPNCNDVSYETSTYNIELLSSHFSIRALYKDTIHTKRFIARIFFPKQVARSFKKYVVTSWTSLLADLGGVFNLCLGLSFITVVEFVYFMTHQLYKNYRSVNHTKLIRGAAWQHH